MKPQRRTLIQLPVDDEKWKELLRARESLAQSLLEIASAMRDLLAPIKTLTNEQKNAVFILGLLIRDMSLAIQPPTGVETKVLDAIRSGLNDALKPLGTIVSSLDPCLKATFEYAGAFQKCRNEGRSEDECLECWEPAALALTCRMKEIELMRNVIAKLLSKQSPPRPAPWPVHCKR